MIPKGRVKNNRYCCRNITCSDLIVSTLTATVTLTPLLRFSPLTTHPHQIRNISEHKNSVTDIPNRLWTEMGKVINLTSNFTVTLTHIDTLTPYSSFLSLSHSLWDHCLLFLFLRMKVMNTNEHSTIHAILISFSHNLFLWFYYKFSFYLHYPPSPFLLGRDVCYLRVHAIWDNVDPIYVSTDTHRLC